MGYRRRYNKKDYGSEAARRHIAEAEEFSREVGGVDSDVKAYFFSLNSHQIAQVFAAYRRLHGDSACNYAQNTLDSWRSGKCRMSGLVAKRLFGLLPCRMPLADKYALVESLWKAKSPTTSAELYIGPNAQASDIQLAVSSHFKSVVRDFQIPAVTVNRFRLLAEGDVTLQQLLQNYYQKMEQDVVNKGLNQILPTLLAHASTSNTLMLERTLEVGKHRLKLIFLPYAIGISATRPTKPITPSAIVENYGCLIVIAIVFIFLMFRSCS